MPGGVLPLGRPQQRLVLAVLLVDAGRPVSTQTLIDRLWREAPDSARRTLQVHVARLRRLLQRSGHGARAALRSSPGGYLLDVAPECVDVHRFRQLMEMARDPRGVDADRIAALRQA